MPFISSYLGVGNLKGNALETLLCGMVWKNGICILLKKKIEQKPQTTELKQNGGLKVCPLQSHVNKVSFVVAKTYTLQHLFSSYIQYVMHSSASNAKAKCSKPSEQRFRFN